MTVASTRPASRSGELCHRVAVVGAGPRGTAIIERLVAASATEQWQGRLEVHLIDPDVGLGGGVWRHDQSEVLLMNTATSQTTMYPDQSCSSSYPVRDAMTLADHLAAEGYAPADIAPRAAHGRYLAAVLARAEQDADPSRLRIIRHATEATDLQGEPNGPQHLTLADGTVLEVDAVGLALGHLRTTGSARSEMYALHAKARGLAHIPPTNPLEADYASLVGRERVAVQGMGLNFYDAVGMLTETCGGTFHIDASTPSGLRYRPGGGEPQLIVGSRSGMVYRPKPDLRPELPDPYEPRILTSARVADLAVREQGLDHEQDVMPLLLAELVRAMRTNGYAALAEEGELLRILFPFGRRGSATADAHERTRAVVRESVAAASDPDPAWVLIFRVLTALRIQVNRLVDLGAYTTQSVQRDIDGHLRNAFASWASGPPVRRVREMLALEEAGLLRFTGPGMAISPDRDSGRFLVRAVDRTGAAVPGAPSYLCDGLIEAHLPGVDLEQYTSPLLRSLRHRGEVRRDAWRARGAGLMVETGSVAIDERYAPTAEDGRVFSRRMLIGIPVTTAQPGSAITAAPGTGAQLLHHAERVATRLGRFGGVLPDSD